MSVPPAFCPSTWAQRLDDLGVVAVNLDTLVPNNLRLAFHHENFRAFLLFLHDNNQSVYQQKYRSKFVGFVNPTSQSAWCLWGDALSVANSLSMHSPEVSRKAFVHYMHGYGYTESNEEDIQNENLLDHYRLQWKAWQCALAFWSSRNPKTTYFPQFERLEP